MVTNDEKKQYSVILQKGYEYVSKHPESKLTAKDVHKEVKTLGIHSMEPAQTGRQGGVASGMGQGDWAVSGRAAGEGVRTRQVWSEGGGQGWSGGWTSTLLSQPPTTRDPVHCFACGSQGHYTWKCPSCARGYQGHSTLNPSRLNLRCNILQTKLTATVDQLTIIAGMTSLPVLITEEKLKVEIKRAFL